MKKTIFTLGLFLGILSTSVMAAETPSCADMKNFSTALHGAADYISTTKGDFSENAQMEKDMDELVVILQAFAEQEGDKPFSDAVDKMEAIWSKKTWKDDDVGDFKRAFDATAVALERVSEKHCNKK